VAKITSLDCTRLLAADRDALVGAFARVLDSGRFVLGPELEHFEAEFASYCGVRYAVGVGNGLDALYLTLRALGIGRGDEVVVPAHTFVATWIAVTRCGATPVAVEPDPRNYLLTADAIEASLTPRTRAVIAVHLYGCISGVERITALCRARNIPLIEDAAQAHGARSGQVRAGAFGIAGCFSFYPTKNLGCLGDGGAVVTSDSHLVESLRSLRNYGSHTRYQHDSEGTNSRLDELQAAMLRVRLPHLDADNSRRHELATMYQRELAGIPELQLPSAGNAGDHVWHQFVVLTDRRDELQKFLAARDCETSIHYPKPVYRFAPFAGFAPQACTTADAVTSRILSLPIGHYLSAAEVVRVCELVRLFFSSQP
jgi:dTDP-3-amino-3,4,6-trideoxy-alpha-D-glucose transaminase